MIILSYVHPLQWRLVVVCLSVVLFSMALMWILRPKTSDLIGAVAAYTAVLVVYIGSSSRLL